MDELSALPPEGVWKKPIRARTSSLNNRQAYTSPSPVTAHSDSQFRLPNVLASPGTSNLPEIIAPTPRRHLLDSSVSQQWLHTPPLSPVSSRAGSPHSNAGRSTSSVTRRTKGKSAQSFSTLFQLEKEYGRQGTSSPLRVVSSNPWANPRKDDGEAAMGRRWIRWMHKRGVKEWVVPTVILAATLVKYCIGLGSYSGENTPPMFGDYEAQRHWMELTIHLPIRKWYTYDLPYWGLDYPPLTAYVSWICGIIAHWINPEWVALDTSRGVESPGSKVFMRTSIIALDTLVYVPSLYMFARTWHGSRSGRTQELSFMTLLLQPALLLIDFGHFQYNSMMLGFTLLSLNFFALERDLLGAFFFVLSLGFKQMALYYAPAIGSYLLAKCLFLGLKEGGRLFVRLAFITSATFLVLFLPFLPPFQPFSALLDPITRIFPFGRGLFEDKVANFWCASNVVFKWKKWATSSSLVKLSTAFTALGFLPSVVVLLRTGVRTRITNNDLSSSETEKQRYTPFLPLLPYALLASSMSFFLFSFQVHEKTILLPLLPITLLMSGSHIGSAVYLWGALVNNVAVFSMWPLLKRDGLGLQYIATLLLWNRLIGYNPIQLPPNSFVKVISVAVYAAATGLHALEFLVMPPARYPDIFAVLNVLISTPIFILVWLWSIKCGVEVGWAVSGLATEKKPPSDRHMSPESSVKDPRDTNGSYRQAGGRAVSLGYGQTQPRHRIRTASVGKINSVVE